MRLAKYLAHAGVASRRASEEIIRDGRVTVAGHVVTDPARDVDDESGVVVDGRPLGGAEERFIYMVNKPIGVFSTAKDPQGRRTITSLVPASGRLYPVGRLDANSTGLILVTNDGALAHQLTHPSFEVPKTYRAKVGGGPVNDRSLRRLREGVRLEGGMTAPARVRRGYEQNELVITIHEGRNRQVRNMCEAVGHKVQSLERVAFGPLKLGALKRGKHRQLTEAEETALRTISRGK